VWLFVMSLDYPRNGAIMKRWLMATAAVLVMATTGQAQAPVDRSNVDARNNTTYTISRPDENGPQCVYRNDVKFYCPPERIAVDVVDLFTEFGPLIRLKDYDLIPLTDSMSGTGERWNDYKLIIVDKVGNATVEKVVDQCFNESCDVRPIAGRDYLNEVYLHIGRKDGYRLSAQFQDGKLSVTKIRLSSKEPLDGDTCDGLFAILEYCRTFAQNNQGVCLRTYGTSNAGNFAMYKVENDYRGFKRESFDKLCRAACESGKKPSLAEFDRQFCDRSRK
jgi:hypothetical protein